MRPLLLSILPAVAVALSAGCGPAPQRLPDRVNIALIDATVGPAMASGKAWDGPGQISLDVLRGVSQALARAPARGRTEDMVKTSAVLAEITAAVAASIAPPDPKGSIELLVAGSSRRLLLPERQDTFNPTWSGVSFEQVPLVEGLRLRVQLFDADDLSSDDPIGTAELTYDDVMAALSYEQVLQVQVYEQTRGQLLFVGISVTPH